MIPCPGFRGLENLSDMRHDTTRHDTTRLVPLADSIHSFSLARYHVTVTCNVHRRPSDVSPRHERVKPNELLYAFVEQAGEKRCDASTAQYSTVQRKRHQPAKKPAVRLRIARPQYIQ
jgi:hypothetical protein